MIIDIFNHIYPREYVDAIPQHPSWLSSVLKKREAVDMQYRIKVMDKEGVDIQVLSAPVATVTELLVPTSSFVKIMKKANDSLSEICEKSHGRFKGVANLSLLDVGEAVDELNRAVKDLGLVGALIPSNVKGKPLDSSEFDPFYDKAEQLNATIWIHPREIYKIYNWVNDDYHMNQIIGWDIDTTFAMFRIMRGGVFERHPKLKIIIHHLGALIPLLAYRINSHIMREGKNGLPPSPLKKSPMELMKMFYVDTAEGMWKLWLETAVKFFGPDHILFGTDFPQAPIKDIMDNVKSLEISDTDKKKILGENAAKLLGIR